MVPPDRAGNDTAFTVSFDHLDAGSGIGAADRALTIRRALAPDAHPGEFQRPGHVFPLRARPGGAGAAGPHRGGGRPGAPRRPASRRGDLRGARRGRLTGPLRRPRPVRRAAPHRDDRGRPGRRVLAQTNADRPRPLLLSSAAGSGAGPLGPDPRRERIRPGVFADLSQRGRDREAHLSCGVRCEVGHEAEAGTARLFHRQHHPRLASMPHAPQSSAARRTMTPAGVHRRPAGMVVMHRRSNGACVGSLNLQ